MAVILNYSLMFIMLLALMGVACLAIQKNQDLRVEDQLIELKEEIRSLKEGIRELKWNITNEIGVLKGTDHLPITNDISNLGSNHLNQLRSFFQMTQVISEYISKYGSPITISCPDNQWSRFCKHRDINIDGCTVSRQKITTEVTKNPVGIILNQNIITRKNLHIVTIINFEIQQVGSLLGIGLCPFDQIKEGNYEAGQAYQNIASGMLIAWSDGKISYNDKEDVEKRIIYEQEGYRLQKGDKFGMIVSGLGTLAFIKTGYQVMVTLPLDNLKQFNNIKVCAFLGKGSKIRLTHERQNFNDNTQYKVVLI